MKRLAGVLLALVVAVALAPRAEAQVVVCGYCCDATGAVRCSINLTPCGGGCFCYGQGNGYAC